MTFELDHVFVAAQSGAPESRLITSAGFIEGSPHHHPGQGTASRGFFFENAYLELIWLTDTQAAAAEPIRKTGLVRRADPTSGVSPYGFGLRSAQDPVPIPPFETWEYSPPYLPEGAAFRMASNSESLDEPLVFVLPWARTPSWEVPEHPNGVRRITRVSFSAAASQTSKALTDFLELGLVLRDEGDAPSMRIEFDCRRQGLNLDLRPHLPILLFL